VTCICDTPYILVIPDYCTGVISNASLTIVSSLSQRVTKLSTKYNKSLLRESLYLDSDTSKENDVDIVLSAARITAWNNIDIMYSEENAVELTRINPPLRQLIINTSNYLAMIIQEAIGNLVEFAKKEFKLSSKDKNGDSLRDTLEKVKLYEGIIHEDLIPIEVHPTVMYLWSYFLQLNNSRQSGMSVNALSYSEIDAWQRLTNTTISPFELSVIKALDSAFISHINSKDSEK